MSTCTQFSATNHCPGWCLPLLTSEHQNTAATIELVTAACLTVVSSLVRCCKPSHASPRLSCAGEFVAAPGRVGSTLLALPGEGVHHPLRPCVYSKASSCRPARMTLCILHSMHFLCCATNMIHAWAWRVMFCEPLITGLFQQQSNDAGGLLRIARQAATPRLHAEGSARHHRAYTSKTPVR